ncbi:MAG: hypothetical protein ABEL76_09915, partial [Bradymonadaceae bacterium]
SEQESREDVSLSISSDAEETDDEPGRIGDEDSLEALVEGERSDAEEVDAETEGDVLDEVLGDDVAAPPSDDFDYEVPQQSPSLEKNADRPADTSSEPDRGDEGEPEADEDDDGDEKEEETGGGLFSGWFGGD